LTTFFVSDTKKILFKKVRTNKLLTFGLEWLLPIEQIGLLNGGGLDGLLRDRDIGVLLDDGLLDGALDDGGGLDVALRVLLDDGALDIALSVLLQWALDGVEVLLDNLVVLDDGGCDIVEVEEASIDILGLLVVEALDRLDGSLLRLDGLLQDGQVVLTLDVLGLALLLDGDDLLGDVARVARLGVLDDGIPLDLGLVELVESLDDLDDSLLLDGALLDGGLLAADASLGHGVLLHLVLLHLPLLLHLLQPF